MASCRGCGKEVIFAVDENGKNQILDMRSPVYYRTGVQNGTERCERVPKDKREALVSHFATCPKAGDFSKNHSKEPPVFRATESEK